MRGKGEYVHLLITRFNITVEFASGRNLDRAWLQERIRVFKRYCRPSVRRQSSQSFEWLILVHPATPQWVRTALTDDGAWNGRVYIVESARVSPAAIVQEWWRSARSKSARWVITSRLDSDDALSRNYLQLVQDQFDRVSCFVRFPYGATYDDQSGSVGMYRDRTCPFLSLIEPATKDIRTVYCRPHDVIGPREAIQVGEQFSWLQIIHRHNVTNRMRDDWGRSALGGFDLTERFGLRW